MVIIKNKNFTLRPLRASDAISFFEVMQDKETQNNLSSFPKDLNEAKKEVKEMLLEVKNKGSEIFTIDVNGKYAGNVILQHQNWDKTSREGRVHLWIHPKFRGMGLGKSALGEVINYGFRKKFDKIFAQCKAINKGVMKINRQLGFTVVKEHIDDTGVKKVLWVKEKENYSKNKNVCDVITGVLFKEPRIQAIFNNGSSVVGMDDSGSDLDFVVVVKKNSDVEKIRELFRKKYKILKNEEDPEVVVEEQYEVLGKRVDPTIISRNDIERKVYSLYESKDSYLELQHFIKHKVVDSIAIYDPDKLLATWKKEVEKYPKKIMKEVFDSQICSIKENLFYWKNHCFRNEFQFGFEQWDLIKAICQALYAKNNRMFMLPYKRLHNDLKDLKPNIEKEMYELIRGRNTSQVIKKKIIIVKKILNKLEK